jgi:uncharacterized protein YecT (DUF1311 family)
MPRACRHRTSIGICVASVFVVFALSAPVARAEETETCDGSTYEMVECLKAKNATWDARLNKAYQQALKDASSREQADKLRTAQRLWLQFREANCRYYDAGEGTIARIDAGECMRSMTEARAKELEGAGKR